MPRLPYEDLPSPDYFFLRSGRCVSAEPATDFCAFVEPLLLKILAAFDATLLDVFSFFAMVVFLSCFLEGEFE